MAIDPLSEQLISFAEAARLLPARRAGKRPHTSCLYRWSVSGCKGVVLESCQCGGTRVTSREALARFIAALSRPGAVTSPSYRTPAQRERAAAAAAAELERDGA